MRPCRALAVDDVGVFLLPPRDESGDEFRRMLKVGVDHDDDIAARVVESGRKRYLLAEISG
jgi:hypothetical protein